MQNLPIIATLPSPPVQAPAPADNSNATPPTEPFNSVLARQRSNTNPPDATAQDAKPAASQASTAIPAWPAPAKDAAANDASNKETPVTAPSATTANTVAFAAPLPLPTLSANTASAASTAPTPDDTPADNKKETVISPSAAPDAIGALPTFAATTSTLAFMNGAQKSISAATGNKKEKVTSQSAAPAASTLPSDILAMMMPAAATHVSASASNSANIAPDTLTASGNPTQALSLTAPLSGEASQVAGNPATTPAADATGAKDHAFSAMLAAAGKDALSSTAPAGGAVPVAGSAPDSLPQSGAAVISVAGSGNAPAQAVQSAINTQVGHDAWGKELGQKVTWMVTQNAHSAELHLNPPNLGPLNVTLKVSGDQATALFTSPHAAVRDAVTQAMPQLRDMLANSGITLGNTTVNDQSPKEQQAWQASQPQKDNGSAPQATTADDIAPGVTVSRISRHQGMVDTFA
jgi:flagellar hook-length control protein FliK